MLLKNQNHHTTLPSNRLQKHLWRVTLPPGIQRWHKFPFFAPRADLQLLKVLPYGENNHVALKWKFLAASCRKAKPAVFRQCSEERYMTLCKWSASSLESPDQLELKTQIPNQFSPNCSLDSWPHWFEDTHFLLPLLFHSIFLATLKTRRTVQFCGSTWITLFSSSFHTSFSIGYHVFSSFHSSYTQTLPIYSFVLFKENWHFLRMLWKLWLDTRRNRDYQSK